MVGGGLGGVTAAGPRGGAGIGIGATKPVRDFGRSVFVDLGGSPFVDLGGASDLGATDLGASDLWAADLGASDF